MKVLLDTHALLWFIWGDSKLGLAAREAIEAPSSRRMLSVASLWEMAVKVSLGKLEVELPLHQLVSRHVLGNGIEVLPISVAHLDELIELPLHHHDPFDRLILAQARVEGATVITKDEKFSQYRVATRW